jgi:cytochrome c oxidase subunit 2
MFSINDALGMVPNAAEHGSNVDHLLEFCHWFMTLLFIGWGCFFTYMLFRFHKSRNPKAIYHGVKSHASTHLEFTVILIEAVLLLGFAFPLWGDRVAPESWPDKDKALRIHAVAEQFAWNFHYAGPDGVFGRQHASLVTADNPVGLDHTDPAAADDIVTKGELHLEQFRPTVVEVTSKDVVHSFALHPMRVTQDAIPGSVVPVWFRPIKTGEFEVVCAQLCGANHYAMKASMITEKKADFEAWQKSILELRKPAAAPTVSTASGFQQLAEAAAR